MAGPGGTDPMAALEQLGAVWSPDFDAYASGELDVSQIRCLICGYAPCDCKAEGLTFGSAAYFARLDELHGRAWPFATCSAPECPMTGQAGEHPRGIAVSGPDGGVCIVDVTR